MVYPSLPHTRRGNHDELMATYPCPIFPNGYFTPDCQTFLAFVAFWCLVYALIER